MGRAGRLLVDGTAEEHLRIGPTCFCLFSTGSIDTLFVDEAGQLPLANLVGSSRAARNLILLGDQRVRVRVNPNVLCVCFLQAQSTLYLWTRRDSFPSPILSVCFNLLRRTGHL